MEKYLEKIKGCEIPSPPSEAPISAVDTSFFFLLSLFVPLLLCYGTVDCKRERKLSNFYTLSLLTSALNCSSFSSNSFVKLEVCLYLGTREILKV